MISGYPSSSYPSMWNFTFTFWIFSVAFACTGHTAVANTTHASAAVICFLISFGVIPSSFLLFFQYVSCCQKIRSVNFFFADNTFWSFFIGFCETISYNIDIKETWISKTGLEKPVFTDKSPYSARQEEAICIPPSIC